MKLMIVDDDDQIRAGIEQGIDWSSLGIDHVITASNGMEAFERFSEQVPEIVVTDVRMPGMDGLELLRQIKKVKPQTRVIILSGYNDFEYLKTAIQLDAVDYEMKPIRARSLIALIEKIKEDIIRERLTEQEFHKYLESYKNNFREDLLSGSISDRLIILEGMQKYYGFDATGPLICVSALMDVDQTKRMDSNLAFADTVCRLFEASELADTGVCLHSKKGKLVFLIRSETVSYLFYQQYVSVLVNQLRAWNRELKSLGLTTFSAGISSSGYASEFIKLLQEANQARSMRLYDGNASIHVYDDRSMALQDTSILGLLENAEFISQMSRGDFTSSILMVQEEFDSLKRERKYSRKSISAFTRNLLQLFMATVRNIPVDLVQNIRNQIEIIQESSESFIIDDFRGITVSIFEEMRASVSKDLSPLMVRADEFIRKNFTRELTVEMLSEHVGKTPNYFSHLFKREFGFTFKEYVTRLRITKAKELILHTNDLIYEISEKVGFSDYTYFTQVFKKIEGCSPAALRKQPHS